MYTFEKFEIDYQISFRDKIIGQRYFSLIIFDRISHEMHSN